MRCKICGRRSVEKICLRCETIREDVMRGLAREFNRKEDALCIVGIDGDRK